MEYTFTSELYTETFIVRETEESYWGTYFDISELTKPIMSIRCGKMEDEAESFYRQLPKLADTMKMLGYKETTIRALIPQITKRILNADCCPTL